MDDMMFVTIFDRPYSMDKQAEGQAVSWAVATNACGGCYYLRECERIETFVPPHTAACMKKKAEILERMKEKQK